MTADLLQFLAARLDEDTAKAVPNLATRGLGDEGTYPDYRALSTSDTDAADAYLRTFNPRRILAEVDAKRRIIAEHPWRREPDWPSGRQCRQCATEYPCTTLRLLVLPYAGHCDYRPEWAPSV
ncbi:DUF6221 family protein [Kitasatospora sp. NPDC057738]|uniref:DUF6221 family protein n=1 Tax=Kitasatospora sp. NPDC057738 TaxID=3346233 RepID=UPI00369AB962